MPKRWQPLLLLSLGALAAIIGRTSAQGSRIPEEDRHSRDQHARDKEQSSSKDPNISQIISLIKSNIEQQNSAKAQEYSNKEFEQYWRKREVIGIWVAASVGTVAIIAAGIFSSWQIREMNDENRAWVALNGLPTVTDIETSLSDFKTIDVTFPVRNVGKEPAKRIVVKWKIIGPRDAVSLLRIQKETCFGGVNPFPIKNSDDLVIEFAMFPSDIGTLGQTVGFSQPELDKLRSANSQKHAIVSAMVGCVDYGFMSGERHQTGFIFEFQRKSGPTAQIDLDAGTVPASDIVFKTSIFGSGPVN